MSRCGSACRRAVPEPAARSGLADLGNTQTAYYRRGAVSAERGGHRRLRACLNQLVAWSAGRAPVTNAIRGPRRVFSMSPTMTSPPVIRRNRSMPRMAEAWAVPIVVSEQISNRSCLLSPLVRAGGCALRTPCAPRNAGEGPGISSSAGNPVEPTPAVAAGRNAIIVSAPIRIQFSGCAIFGSSEHRAQRERPRDHPGTARSRTP